MTIKGKTSVAPCGHTGETIIGTYVRCLMGCEGKPVMSKRGVPGHVDNCACPVCQIRRKATTIVLRSKDGKDFCRVAWDGISDEIVVDNKRSGEVRGYLLLDVDGKVVARGTAEAYLEPGQMKIKTKFMVDAAVKCEVCKDGVYQSMEVAMDAIAARIQTFLNTPSVISPLARAGQSPKWVGMPPAPTVVKGP